MFKSFLEMIKDFFCRHEEVSFIRNIYGDEINHVSLSHVYRSWWKCEKCGCLVLRKELVK